MKFINFSIAIFFKISFLYSQCSPTNQVIISEITFDTPTDGSINIVNNTGESFQLQQKKMGGNFQNTGVIVKDQGNYVFKASDTEESCFRLTSTSAGCLPSNSVCLPSWKLNSEPNQNVIDIVPPLNDEILVLKNNKQDIRFVSMNSPFQYIDKSIVCRKDDVYRIVVINGSTKINTYKWTIRALAGDCAVQDIVLPSIFTPNTDGFNDSFTPIGKADDFYSLTIVDKWNNTVFESPTFLTQWNGNLNNGTEPSPEGLYQYILKKLDKDANIITVNGHVFLTR